MTRQASVDPAEARAAVASTAGRLTGLLRSATSPAAPALGEWDAADVAVHLSHAVDAVTASARGSESVLDDVWDLSTMSGLLVRGEATRDLSAIADRIEAGVATFLSVAESAAGDPSRSWLVKGVEVPMSTLACQVLNELAVHGRDIAVAQGAPWAIPRPHAALVLLGYLFPALDSLGGAMVDQQAAAGVRATYEVRLRGGGRAFVRFDDGDLTVGAEPPGPIDCHLSVDPETFLLVSWGRLGQWPAIGRGRLLAWGRRPWLGLRLREMLKNP
ncbi:MAG: SCP2 sterol-binding domain-containing protein [Actinomycetota bacterium]|nr:SCP2 sterol-binding domain-containing protein [Actinomycetota bacterium]